MLLGLHLFASSCFHRLVGSGGTLNVFFYPLCSSSQRFCQRNGRVKETLSILFPNWPPLNRDCLSHYRELGWRQTVTLTTISNILFVRCHLRFSRVRINVWLGLAQRSASPAQRRQSKRALTTTPIPSSVQLCNQDIRNSGEGNGLASTTFTMVGILNCGSKEVNRDTAYWEFPLLNHSFKKNEDCWNEGGVMSCVYLNKGVLSRVRK